MNSTNIKIWQNYDLKSFKFFHFDTFAPKNSLPMLQYLQNTTAKSSLIFIRVYAVLGKISLIEFVPGPSNPDQI